MFQSTLLAATAAAFVSVSASAGIIASWSFTTAIPTGTVGLQYLYGAADSGEQTAASSLSASHVNAAASYTTAAGNGSQYSFNSNNWTAGDAYYIRVSTAGYSAISVQWDQTRSSTGPSSFSFDMSVNGGASWSTLNSSITVIQAGGTGTNTLSWSSGGAYQSAFTTVVNADASADNQNLVLFRIRSNVTTSAAGTSRIDNVIVSGVPAPGAIGLLGIAGLLSRRRR
jgi:MYXO-CTERM domain-containing protein